jgi:hypothetical protein
MPPPDFSHSPGDYCENGCRNLVSKSIRLQLAPKDATYAGATGFARNVAAHDLAAVCPARAGKWFREEFNQLAVTQRYLAKHPLDAQGNISCPHGAASNT